VSQLPFGWVEFFDCLAKRSWFNLELLEWDEPTCHFVPVAGKLECQIVSLGGVGRSNQIVIHANVRGDASFTFIARSVNFKFDPDGTAELPMLIDRVKIKSVA